MSLRSECLGRPGFSKVQNEAQRKRCEWGLLGVDLVWFLDLFLIFLFSLKQELTIHFLKAQADPELVILLPQALKRRL